MLTLAILASSALFMSVRAYEAAYTITATSKPACVRPEDLLRKVQHSRAATQRTDHGKGDLILHADSGPRGARMGGISATMICHTCQSHLHAMLLMW